MTLTEAQRILDEGSADELAGLIEQIVDEDRHLLGRPNAAEWARIEDEARCRLYPDTNA